MNLDYSETNLLVAGFKKSAKILKFNSQGIEPQVWHDSLNQFQYFEIKNCSHKRLIPISTRR